MTIKKSVCVTASMAMLSLSFNACNPESNNADISPINHQQVRQAVTDNTVNIAEKVAQALQFLESSELFQSGFDMMIGSLGDEVACFSGPDPDDQPPEPVMGEGGQTDDEEDDDWEDEYYECESSEPISFEADFDDDIEELAAFLDAYVFAQDNIESEDSGTVTYLVNGALLCEGILDSEDQDEESIEECASVYDDAELRLKAGGTSDGDIDVAVLLGPNQIHPLSVRIGDDEVAVNLSLPGIKSAILYSASLDNTEAPEMPSTMVGKIEVSLRIPDNTQIVASVSILEDIIIADEDIEIIVAAANPAFEVVADSALETLAASLNLGPFSGFFTVTDSGYEYDDVPVAPPTENGGMDERNDGEYPENDYEPHDPYTVGMDIGGVSIAAVFEVGQELFKLSNLGLGDKTSVIKINGEQVVEIDINADAGRQFSVDIQKTDDGAEFAFSPQLDVKVAFELIKVADVLRDIPEFLFEDVFTLNLSGADKPTVLLEDEQLKVSAGVLTVSSQTEGITHSVEAGMCLVGVDDDEEHSEEGPHHPMTMIEEATCE